IQPEIQAKSLQYNGKRRGTETSAKQAKQTKTTRTDLAEIGVKKRKVGRARLAPAIRRIPFRQLRPMGAGRKNNRLQNQAVTPPKATRAALGPTRLKNQPDPGKRGGPERWPSGLRRTLGKRVYGKTVPWVRIPLSPPPAQMSSPNTWVTE